MTKKTSFSDQLRRLIESSGQTRYRIAKETGIDAATLCRFVNGQSGLSIDNLDTLAAHLGWTVSAKPAASKPVKSKGGK